MESKLYQEKLCNEFEAMGLGCKKVDHFVWSENQREFEFIVTLDFKIFIDSSENEYKEERIEKLKKFEKYNEDKMKLYTVTKGSKQSINKMDFVVYHSGKGDILPGVYMRKMFFDLIAQPYNSEWNSFLEQNGYATEIVRSKIAGVFSKTNGEQIVRSAMNELENEMNIIQKWLNREIKIRVGKKIKLLDGI